MDLNVKEKLPYKVKGDMFKMVVNTICANENVNRVMYE